VRIALAQIDTTAGDVAGNQRRILAAARRAAQDGADLVVLPELAVVGYPPRDLLLRAGVLRAVEAATREIARALTGGPEAILGTVAANPEATGKPIVNAAAHLAGGEIRAVYAKRLLPTYDVFDEQRYFAPGSAPCVVSVAGRRVGLLICEDLWRTDLVAGRALYAADPPADLARAGIDFAVAISASPYHGGKDAHRCALFAGEAGRMATPLLSVNLVGGNDDVLFDGRSRVFDASGTERLRLPAFEECVETIDLDEVLSPGRPGPAPEALPEAEELRRALRMGIAAYARKTGMPKALVGLSGGVDSAVTACLAADALGPENVLAVAMPGPFTAPMSNEDARELCRRRRIELVEIPITPPYEAFARVLKPLFEDRPFDTTEENLQARARGTVLMALSNKFGHLVLATGNKSEFSVGYCTLYGDMNGGLAVLSDVWKTRVYEVARLYEAEGAIPSRVIERPPSAELRADQTDQDTLPPYRQLDRILRARVERGLSLTEIVAGGEDPATAERVLRMVDRSEYKRRQMAPGLKVTPTAFGVGWRMPIARPVDLSGER
jgi:NAD+ synthetase